MPQLQVFIWLTQITMGAEALIHECRYFSGTFTSKKTWYVGKRVHQWTSLLAAWLLLHSFSTFSIPRPSWEMLLQSAGDCTLDMLLQMLIKSSQAQLYIPTFVKVIIMAYRVSFQTYYSEPLCTGIRMLHEHCTRVMVPCWRSDGDSKA